MDFCDNKERLSSCKNKTTPPTCLKVSGTEYNEATNTQSNGHNEDLIKINSSMLA